MKDNYLNIIKIAFFIMFVFIGFIIFIGLHYNNKAETVNVWVSGSKVVEDNFNTLVSYFPNLTESEVKSIYTGEIIDYHDKITICDINESRKIILRLDDVKAWQYYDITIRMVSLILSKDITVTLGVIPKDIEKDTTLFLPWINDIKNNPKIEIALHGYLHEDAEFKYLNRDEASYKLEKGKELLYTYIGIVPVTFVAPENEYSDGTIDALSDKDFRVIGGGKIDTIHQYYKLGENLTYVGYTTQVYDYPSSEFIPTDQVLAECNSGLDKEGLCVIEMHPQEYLTIDRTQIDEVKYAEFVRLLDGLKNLNATFKNFKDVAECIP